MTANQWKEILEDEYENYYKFTIVRNPYDKCLSIKKFSYRNNSIKDIREMEKWVLSQDIFIEDKDGNVIVDDVFHHENLEEVWGLICEKLHIEEKPLIHKNNKKNLNLKLSENEIKWIKVNLKNDFNKFNYKL